MKFFFPDSQDQIDPAFDFSRDSRLLIRKKLADNGELAFPRNHLRLRHRDLHRCVARPAGLAFSGSIASNRRERDKEWHRAAREGKNAHRGKKARRMRAEMSAVNRYECVLSERNPPAVLGSLSPAGPFHPAEIIKNVDEVRELGLWENSLR